MAKRAYSKKYDLIIFDCDGTLVDSEGIIASACSKILQEMGYKQYTYDYFAKRFASISLYSVVKVLTSELGPSFNAEEFMRKSLNQELLAQHLMPIPGAKELLAHLQNADYPMCVASNGEMEMVVKSLNTVGLLEYFKQDHIFTYRQSNNIPKPAPDLFLFAAKNMGDIDPSRCLVIEDSDTGVRAAKAANMDVLVIQAHLHPRFENIVSLKPNAIISNLMEVLDHY